MPVIASLINLSKIYSKPGTSVQVAALRDINLNFERGVYTAIMGASGSGKSTLMNILGCLDRPTTGTYMLGDEDVSGLEDNILSEIRTRRIGFVFQNFNLIQQLTVLENLEVPMFYAGTHAAQRRSRALELAARVGLEERLDHRPTQLSGGQQQRVCIARALANDPLMILADEPTGNLDSKTGQSVLELFDELVANGTTILVVTHDPGVAARCHRIIHLHDGLVQRDEQASQAVPVM